MLDYIRRNYITETVIKQRGKAEATRIVNFPYEAIEEAVVNAVYHRSYEEREPIEVRITREDLVVLSFPGPDRSIRMKDLRTGKTISRRYRNRRIGEFLKELDLTEGRSTGIPKILNAMRQNGSPTPEFETGDDRTYFLIRLPVHPESKQIQEETDQAGGEATPQVTRLLEVLKDGARDRDSLMGKLSLHDRKHFRTIYLNPALDAGLVEMTQPDSPRSPTQKYRITQHGKTVLGIKN